MARIIPTARPLRYGGRPAPIGQEVEVADVVAADWVRRGLATRPKARPEVPASPETAEREPGETPESRRGRRRGAREEQGQ